MFMEAAAEPTQTQYFSLKQVPESEDVTLQYVYLFLVDRL